MEIIIIDEVKKKDDRSSIDDKYHNITGLSNQQIKMKNQIFR